MLSQVERGLPCCGRGQGAGGRGGEDGGLVLVLWGVKHGKLAHREYRVSD